MRFMRVERTGEGVLLNFRTSRHMLSNHDLVCVNGWTVDITRDQLGGETRPVIVEPDSAIPPKWKLLGTYTLDELVARRSDPALGQMYLDILEFLP